MGGYKFMDMNIRVKLHANLRDDAGGAGSLYISVQGWGDHP